MTYEDDVLRATAAQSTCMSDFLDRLGVEPTPGRRQHHFTGQAHMRGRASSRRATPDEGLTVRPPGSPRVQTPRLRRVMLEVAVPYRCASCGLGPEWQEPPLTLIIDHVNGDWLDNRLANLRFLCPNCHALTATWCRKKGP